ncbi:MAG: xanthine dehydrogenase family protein molybdopterin-binding subunit [SAR324 cluster bacterium]|nr:xanthine dehydrogenase family protein molybdopterin-binding subunit [SAR324 cluster bacterium]
MTDINAVSNTPNSYKWVGTRPVRHDGLEKVNGHARFAADLSLPRMLSGHVLRSPFAHARIISIDTKEAEAMPGVKAVITSADFPEPHRKDYVSLNLMARDKVFYEGQAVAAVAAGTKRQAKAAAEKIVVQYQELPHVLSIDEAMAEDAPLLHENLITKGVEPVPGKASNIPSRTLFERGDLDAGFKEADVVFEQEFTTKVVHQGYIEPHAVVADTSSDDRSVIWCSSQGHFMIRAKTAAMLGWEPSQLKVIPAEIGGGFGGKTTIYLEPLAAKLSQKAKRPVKIVMSRDEVFRATGPTPGTKLRIKLGAKKNGKIVAGKAWLAYENGAYPGIWGMLGAMCLFAPYDIPNFYVEAFEVVVNKPVNIAYRAPSAPMAAFATETVVDQIARELKLDPIELRLINAVEEGSRKPDGPKYGPIGFKETLEAIRNHPNYSIPLGPNQGRGIASGYWFNIGESSSATVHLTEDGTAIVVTGSPDIGGSRASMALMAAEELGIDVKLVQPRVADTDSIGFTDVTEGSRTTFATGMAVVGACRQLIDELRKRAAMMWEVDIDEVEWMDGNALHTVNKHAPLALAEITKSAKKTGGPLTTTHSLEARGAGAAFSTQMCDLEVDPETGAVTILRYTTAQDAGTAIHPGYVEGQFQGGVAQGIGWALNEEYVHNAEGVMENPGFLDYRIPVASDLPMIETIIVEVPNPKHPYGVRGVGEVGIVPPIPAVANAIHDATGLRMRRLPMSPMTILAGLNQKNGSA